MKKSMEEKAQMVYPHADHSLCAIEGFIYVVGTFVKGERLHGNDVERTVRRDAYVF